MAPIEFLFKSHPQFSMYWTNIAVTLKHIVVDAGFRGMDADKSDKKIMHRGKFRSLSKQQKGRLKRQAAVQPAIAQMKFDYRMERCWLQGGLGAMPWTRSMVR